MHNRSYSAGLAGIAPLLSLVFAGAMVLASTACGGAAAGSPAASTAAKAGSSSSSTSSSSSSTTTSASSASGRLLTSSSANWLYSGPTGTGMIISASTSGLKYYVSAHDGGFDFPVQYADGSNGCVNFTDTLYYDLTDKFCVPKPSGGFKPSVGGYGANDGHLVVVDTTHNAYYDFWKLLVDANGNPTSTNVGKVRGGTLSTSNGTPGTTASDITGLAGDIMPGELDCETCLNHALNTVVPSSMNSTQVAAQAPVAKTDGSVPGGVFRYGAKLVFDPSVNVDNLTGVSTAVKALMKALQKYGAVITDQTTNDGIAFYSSLATDPDLTGIAQIGQHLQIYY